MNKILSRFIVLSLSVQSSLIGISGQASAAEKSADKTAEKTTLKTTEKASVPVSAVAAASHFKLPVPEIETLPNGLQVVWFVNDSLPVVDFALLVKSGSRDDPKGKSGTAEFVAELLDRGAGGLTSQQIALATEGLGATRYGSADDDLFSIGVHGLAPDAAPLLDVLTKMVMLPEFPQDQFKKAQLEITERWSHIGDSVETLASMALQRLSTAGTTYSRGGMISLKEFKKIKREDLIEYHQRHFTPKNSLLMVVGRVDKNSVREQISKGFGTWKGDVPKRQWVTGSDSKFTPRKNQILIVNRPGATQAQVRFGMKIPPIHWPQRYALAVGNALLGEYFNSRLNAVLRDQMGLTYSIGSSISYSQDLARLAIGSATETQHVGKLVKKTVDILKDLKKGTVTAEEVQVSKDYLVGGFPLSVSTLGSVASRWVGGYLYQLGPDYLNEFVPKISALDVQDVNKAVREGLKLEDLVIVVAGNAKDIIKSLKQSGFNNFRQISAEDLK